MKRGYHLLEVILVIMFIAIVLAVAFLLTNPIIHWRESSDIVRVQDLVQVSEALQLSKVDNLGRWIPSVEVLPMEKVFLIGAGQKYDFPCLKSPEGIVDLRLLVDQKYLTYLPINQSKDSDWNDQYSGYYLIRNVDGTITLGSCVSEKNTILEVTR